MGRIHDRDFCLFGKKEVTASSSSVSLLTSSPFGLISLMFAQGLILRDCLSNKGENQPTSPPNPKKRRNGKLSCSRVRGRRREKKKKKSKNWVMFKGVRGRKPRYTEERKGSEEAGKEGGKELCFKKFTACVSNATQSEICENVAVFFIWKIKWIDFPSRKNCIGSQFRPFFGSAFRRRLRRRDPNLSPSMTSSEKGGVEGGIEKSLRFRFLGLPPSRRDVWQPVVCEGRRRGQKGGGGPFPPRSSGAACHIAPHTHGGKKGGGLARRE